MAKNQFNLWDATAVKTSRQFTLWLITIASMVIFSNNVVQWWGNFIDNPGLVGLFNLLTFMSIRIILGFLFDNKGRK